ncbi:unnamed protein product [Symbiodinium sp. CCMP2592]|nr:unnamed protein product [Symbiodinium sp. CCMP2592]
MVHGPLGPSEVTEPTVSESFPRDSPFSSWLWRTRGRETDISNARDLALGITSKCLLREVLSQSWQIVGQPPLSQPPGSAGPASFVTAQASPQKQQQQQQQQLGSWQVVGQASPQLAPGGYGYQPSPGFVTAQASFQVPSKPMPGPYYQVPPGVALPGGFPQQQSPMGFQQFQQVQKLSPPSAGKKLFGQDTEDKTLGGIILTLCDGSSYDPIFKEMSQSDDDGTVPPSHAVAMRSAEELGKAIEEGQTQKPELAELLKDLQAVPKEKVVFNWECCSGCSEAGFPHGPGFAMQYPQRAPSFVKLHQAPMNVKLAKLALDRGYMVMFADFSLKALIASWSEELLGPNPFRQLGVTQGKLRLTFSPETLKQSSSKQLVKVGELCTSGTADIHAMGSTIVYGVVDEAEKRANTSGAYRLQRLTEAAALGDQGPSSAGHVMLTYPSGGRLLTSAGHWKELTHLGGVSEEGLLRVAEQRFGQAYSAQIQTSLQQCKTEFGRQQMQQSYASACRLYSLGKAPLQFLAQLGDLNGWEAVHPYGGLCAAILLPCADGRTKTKIHKMEPLLLFSMWCRVSRAAQSGRVGWNIVHCNVALSALADASQWSRQLRIFATLQEHQVRPTASTFGALLAAGAVVASWQGALALLEEMPQWQVQRDTVACNTAITACAKAAQWEAACELVRSMRMAMHRVDTITQNALMSAFHQGSQWEQALALLASLHHGCRTVVTWSTCISAQEASGRWQVALELLAGMCREVGGSTIGYNACISVCARGQAWPMAFRLLEDMQEKRVRPDTVSFNATISASSEGVQWQPALGLFDRMMKERVPHDLVSFNATMDACAMSGEWRPALSLLCAAGAQANLVSFNTALTACHRGSAWAASLALFALLQRRNLQPDTLTYNVMMSVGHKSARWPLALQMLRSLHLSRLAPTDRSAGAVVSACERAEQWELALELFQDLGGASVQRSRVVFNAAMSACAKGAQWENAMRLYRSLQRSLKPDEVSQNSLLCALAAAAQWEDTLALLQLPGLRHDGIGAQTALDAFARSSRWRQALQVVCRHRLHTDVARQTTMESCQRAGHWSPLRRASSVSGSRAKEQALLQRFDAVVAAGRSDTPFLIVPPNDEQQLSTLTRSALQSALALAKRLLSLADGGLLGKGPQRSVSRSEAPVARISAKLVVADKDYESAARRQINALEAAKASAAAAISRKEKAAAKQAAAVKAAEAKRIAAQKAAEKAAEAKRIAAQKAPEKVSALPSKTGKTPEKVRYIDSGPAAGWHVKGRAYPTAITMWVLPPNGSVWLSRVQALKELEGSDPTVIEAIDRVRWQVQQELKGRAGPVAEPSAAEGGTRKKLRLSWSEESHHSSSSSSSSVRMLS